MPELDASNGHHAGLTRRTLLVEGAGTVAAGTLAGRLIKRPRAWWRPAYELTQRRCSQLEALRVLGRTPMRLPDSLPNASLAVGTDTIPQIDHVVVLMPENDSYDNHFLMLGPEPGRRPGATASFWPRTDSRRPRTPTGMVAFSACSGCRRRVTRQRSEPGVDCQPQPVQ